MADEGDPFIAPLLDVGLQIPGSGAHGLSPVIAEKHHIMAVPESTFDPLSHGLGAVHRAIGGVDLRRYHAVQGVASGVQLQHVQGLDHLKKTVLRQDILQGPQSAAFEQLLSCLRQPDGLALGHCADGTAGIVLPGHQLAGGDAGQDDDRVLLAGRLDVLQGGIVIVVIGGHVQVALQHHALVLGIAPDVLQRLVSILRNQAVSDHQLQPLGHIAIFRIGVARHPVHTVFQSLFQHLGILIFRAFQIQSPHQSVRGPRLVGDDGAARHLAHGLTDRPDKRHGMALIGDPQLDRLGGLQSILRPIGGEGPAGRHIRVLGLIAVGEERLPVLHPILGQAPQAQIRLLLHHLFHLRGPQVQPKDHLDLPIDQQQHIGQRRGRRRVLDRDGAGIFGSSLRCVTHIADDLRDHIHCFHHRATAGDDPHQRQERAQPIAIDRGCDRVPDRRHRAGDGDEADDDATDVVVHRAGMLRSHDPILCQHLAEVAQQRALQQCHALLRTGQVVAIGIPMSHRADDRFQHQQRRLIHGVAHEIGDIFRPVGIHLLHAVVIGVTIGVGVHRIVAQSQLLAIGQAIAIGIVAPGQGLHDHLVQIVHPVPVGIALAGIGEHDVVGQDVAVGVLFRVHDVPGLLTVGQIVLIGEPQGSVGEVDAAGAIPQAMLLHAVCQTVPIGIVAIEGGVLDPVEDLGQIVGVLDMDVGATGVGSQLGQQTGVDRAAQADGVDGDLMCDAVGDDLIIGSAIAVAVLTIGQSDDEPPPAPGLLRGDILSPFLCGGVFGLSLRGDGLSLFLRGDSLSPFLRGDGLSLVLRSLLAGDQLRQSLLQTCVQRRTTGVAHDAVDGSADRHHILRELDLPSCALIEAHHSGPVSGHQRLSEALGRLYPVPLRIVDRTLGIVLHGAGLVDDEGHIEGHVAVPVRRQGSLEHGVPVCDVEGHIGGSLGSDGPLLVRVPLILRHIFLGDVHADAGPVLADLAILQDPEVSILFIVYRDHHLILPGGIVDRQRDLALGILRDLHHDHRGRHILLIGEGGILRDVPDLSRRQAVAAVGHIQLCAGAVGIGEGGGMVVVIIPNPVLVGIRFSGVRADGVLAAVPQTIPIGVLPERIGPQLFLLQAIVQTVAVRIGHQRRGAQFQLPQAGQAIPVLICVTIPYAVAVAVIAQRIGHGQCHLVIVGDPVAVGILQHLGGAEGLFDLVGQLIAIVIHEQLALIPHDQLQIVGVDIPQRRLGSHPEHPDPSLAGSLHLISRSIRSGQFVILVSIFAGVHPILLRVRDLVPLQRHRASVLAESGVQQDVLLTGVLSSIAEKHRLSLVQSEPLLTGPGHSDGRGLLAPILIYQSGATARRPHDGHQGRQHQRGDQQTSRHRLQALGMGTAQQGIAHHQCDHHHRQHDQNDQAGVETLVHGDHLLHRQADAVGAAGGQHRDVQSPVPAHIVQLLREGQIHRKIPDDVLRNIGQHQLHPGVPGLIEQQRALIIAQRHMERPIGSHGGLPTGGIQRGG